MNKRRRAASPPPLSPVSKTPSTPNDRKLLLSTAEMLPPASPQEGTTEPAEMGGLAECVASLSPPPADPSHSPTATILTVPPLLLHKGEPTAAEGPVGGGVRRLYDVGYSSGENSVHEALNQLAASEGSAKGDSVDESSQPERVVGERLSLSATDYYRTVPLDDAGK